MKKKIFTTIIFLSLLIVSNIHAAGNKSNLFEQDFNRIILKDIKEDFTYYGLANFYNNLFFFIKRENNITKIKSTFVSLAKKDSLIIVNRFNIFEIKFNDNLEIKLNRKVNENYYLTFNKLQHSSIKDISIKKFRKDDSDLKLNNLYDLKYHHLWKPLASLSIVIESTFIQIHRLSLSYNWGITILIFAIFFKILFLPIAIWTKNLQNDVIITRNKIEPLLKEIKSSLKGEEAHKKTMQVYKDLRVSPYYQIKPMIGLLIQIPFLIAIFNVLGEMPQLDNMNFLWISNLAYPDASVDILLKLPFFGNEINSLPILMSLISVISTFYYSNNNLSYQDIKKQKRNLYVMSLIFLILFYTFPASMVLYWLYNNLIQLVLQKYMKI